ncbi:MAG: membrane protein insertase YidC [Pseudomonadota bacterium]
MGDNRNFILAIAITIGILFLYNAFVLEPMGERQRAAQEASAEAGETPDVNAAPVVTMGADGEPVVIDEPSAPGALSRDDALALSERVDIRTPALEGSIALTGARFDDLQLLRYDTEVESDIPVTLLTPREAPLGHYVINGWAGAAGAPDDMPGADTPWRLASGSTLTPETPITLEYATGDLVFRRTISVDADYLFTVTDTVTNNGSAPASMARYAQVRQHGKPADLTNFFILHEGLIGMVGDELIDRKYNKLDNDGGIERSGEGAWMGVTSKYWLAAAAPAEPGPVTAQFQVRPSGDQNIYESNYIRAADTLAPGGTLTTTAYVYAGSKDVQLLQRYQDEQGIARFDMAVDWGMFWFLTRPFFYLLDLFNGWLGNFGLAIMAVTVLTKLALFPLNNRAFASMAKMRAAAPRMTELRETYKDDPQKQQQAIMEMYRKEKINPLAGCLPILPQIPIFFALYKIVFISLEARHAPFFGWIRDMSAPDPTSMWNLFGLLPYDPAGVPIIGGVLAIGAWPILMGITMWAQQALNPPPPDKIQRQIFAFMPIIFTIVLAPFAAALVIYWTWNNFLTILQQYIIMRRQGVETELDKKIGALYLRYTGKTALAAPSADGEATATSETISVTPESADGEAPANEAEAESEAKSEAKPAAQPGARTRSNPAAKKPRGGARAKRATTRKKPAPRKKPTSDEGGEG